MRIEAQARPWILNSPFKDFSYFYLPVVISLMIAIFFSNLAKTSLVYAFLATALVDSGHVYTTFWRRGDGTIKDKFYWIIPLVVFILISIWGAVGAAGLWSIVVYLTVFHHVRQNYGFSRWYQRLNNRICHRTSFFIYALALLPFISFHFRELSLSYYSDSDLFMYPHSGHYQYGLVCYLVVFVCALINELILWKDGIREFNRMLHLVLVGITYGYCFLLGENLTQVLFPLLLMHGISYFAVMSDSLRKRKFKNYSLLIVLSTAFVMGGGEAWFEENMQTILNRQGRLFSHFIIGLYLMPLLSHYILDAFLWRRRTIAPLADK